MPFGTVAVCSSPLAVVAVIEQDSDTVTEAVEVREGLRAETGEEEKGDRKENGEDGDEDEETRVMVVSKVIANKDSAPPYIIRSLCNIL